MTRLQISLSDKAAEIVARAVKARGLAGPSEYIQELVLQEHQAIRAEIDALILEGLNSGPAFPIDAEWWKRKRTEWLAELKADAP
jgi:hypothetical protein